MPKIHASRVLLMAGIAGAIVFAGSAANAAKATREAALERCSAQARGSDVVVPREASGENRAVVYKDWMRQAAYKP